MLLVERDESGETRSKNQMDIQVNFGKTACQLTRTSFFSNVNYVIAALRHSFHDCGYNRASYNK